MSQPILKIITTEDGSHSLYREDINETYHSSHGARAESQHIFIKTGLEYLLFEKGKKDLKIFEVGFGTGLNALLAALFGFENKVKIDYHSIEPIPVGEEIYAKLNYGTDQISTDLLKNIHAAPWAKTEQLNAFFKLTKYETTIEAFDQTEAFDIIFFDAFAPSKQPEVWALANIQKCYNILKPGGILNTYCAQGQFKRNLKAVGFEVECPPGAMGKRQMVRAVRLGT
ncbi:MAG: tRNA U34 5-methylaminomethyl-2-thiouridine-forming methyltransferase MnmC [Cyclobacteriaceae bacterium]|jgi:tRNA U34 5-methylaminomethyl-2-thiouridine-forming methyltransferase MnmC